MPERATHHVRFNDGLLAASERRLLDWIARRLPEWITPDHLSALGLASMAVAGAAFAAFEWDASAAAWAVVAALAANWFGDSLDGTVARVRRTERPRYGYYVDHVIDLAGTAFLFTGMACSGLMSPLLALSLLGAYLLVCAETYLATYATGVFRMSFFGCGPSELRVLLAIGAVKAAHGASVTIAGRDLRLFDAGAGVAIAGLAVTFIISTARNTRALYRAEPVPRRVVTRAA
jgi:archaetidylinositol phosphate synthase